MSSLKHEALSSLFWKFLERVGSSLLGLVIQVILARLLMPDDYGLLAIIVVFVNLSNVFVQSGLGSAIIQTPHLTREDCSTVFWFSGAVACFFYCLVFFASPFMADFYGSDDIVWPLRVLMLTLFLSSLSSIQLAQLIRALELKRTFKATLAALVVSGVAGIASAFLGAGIWALVLQQLLNQTVMCVMLTLETKWHPERVFSFVRIKELLGFGWKLLASGLLETSYRSLSDLIIGKQFSVATLGLVAQGERYPQTIGTILDGTIQPVMFSATSRVQNDLKAVKSLARRALKTSSFLIVPAMGCFALIAEPLVNILLGPQWLPSVSFLQMYCFVFALLPIHTTNLQVLNGLGRSDVFLKLEVIKKVYSIAILLFAAFVLQNVYAIVVGAMMASFLATFVNAYPNRKIIKYGYLEQARDICPAFGLAALAAMCAWPVQLMGLPDILCILVQSAVMATVYVGAAKLFRLEELTYILDTMKEYMHHGGEH